MNDDFNWTECAVIRANGYRLIDEAPNYAIGRAGHVWRLPTLSPGKGGSIRLLKAHQLTPDKGRVKLRHNGETVPYSVNGLHRKYHPEAHEVRAPPPVRLAPPHLQWLDNLMQERPASVPWGSGDYSPGCHGFAARGNFRRPCYPDSSSRCPTDVRRTVQRISSASYRTGQIGQASC
jgi:hypothetical protein